MLGLHKLERAQEIHEGLGKTRTVRIIRLTITVHPALHAQQANAQTDRMMKPACVRGMSMYISPCDQLGRATYAFGGAWHRDQFAGILHRQPDHGDIPAPRAQAHQVIGGQVL